MRRSFKFPRIIDVKKSWDLETEIKSSVQFL
jgi:hypothetical protein